MEFTKKIDMSDELRAAIQSYSASPDPIQPIAPRVRRNYTQGANGTWRAEFTVESYRDPTIPNDNQAIRDEDAEVALAIRDMLAVLNHRGTPEAPMPD
jgi:hypothetical protein